MLARKDFTVYPAIDVLEGRVVRLSEGRREAVTVEGGDPVAAARALCGGGRLLAPPRRPRRRVLRRSRPRASSPASQRSGLPVQVGGGYRSLDSIEAALEAGAARVLVGTAALDDEFLSAAAARFGDGIVVAIDARDGSVTVHGWTRSTELTPAELARRCAAAGVRRVLVTSAQRDGTLSGPDLPLLESVLEAGLPVIAAGGIAALDDLRAAPRARLRGRRHRECDLARPLHACEALEVVT